MMNSPAVIVHGLAMARLALAPGLPVTLLSAPGAGGYAGVGWWLALIEAARAAYPGTPLQHILDCGDAPGRALEALRAGQDLLVLHAPPLIWNDIAGRAAQRGGHLLSEAPPALDLATRGALRGLDAWLREGARL